MNREIMVIGSGDELTPLQWHELQLKYPNAEFITPEEADERALLDRKLNHEMVLPFTVQAPLPPVYATTVFNRGGKNILSARNQRRLAERKSKKGK